MNENPAAAEWASSRGEKWRAQLAGMEAMLAPVNEPLIRALHLDAPLRIADIGCGGGGATLEILRQAPLGSVVHGFDISPALIEMARARRRSDESTIAFEVADMANAAAPGELYDRLASRFGVMFFDDPAAAFGNLVRWLAPGGRFALAVWGGLAGNPWITTVREVVAGIVEMPPADPEAPGPFRYAEAGKLIEVLDGVGFGDLEVSEWRGRLPTGGGLPPAEAAYFALASFSSFGELLAEAGGDAFNEAQRLLTERLSGYQEDGVVRMDASVHVFTGGRPE